MAVRPVPGLNFRWCYGKELEKQERFWHCGGTCLRGGSRSFVHGGAPHADGQPRGSAPYTRPRWCHRGRTAGSRFS